MAGSGDLAIDRSLILGGARPSSSTAPRRPRDPRRYFFHRSILASRGVGPRPAGRALDLAAAGPGARARRSRRSAGLDTSGLINAQPDASGPRATAVDWLGHDNAYVGWPSWLDAGEHGAKSLVADLAAARATWKGIGRGRAASQRRGWPIDDLAIPSALAALAEARPAVLARVAEPQPSLIEATVGSFARLPIPRCPAGRPRLRACARGRDSARAADPRLLADVPRVAGVNASIEPGKERPSLGAAGLTGASGTGRRR